LGIADKVKFHGYVDEASLAKRLPHYDVFIQHSRIKEGSPVSIVEAMACALPVVATPIGGIPDQIDPGRTGYLVPIGDVDGMAAAMAQLASDPKLRARLGREARAEAVARHDCETLTAQLGNLLMTTANAHKQRM
ncbi:MAG: glycosyltransferase, partial [Hyphomicrobiales bacterium]